ncbi:hypothetical protein GQ457_13G028420 [Hibiscus cannabinus]
MEESNNYGHRHPLLLLNENRLIIYGSDAVCNRCWNRASAPCFSCPEEGCWFFLDKVCAEAPLELSHPFHPHHPLLLIEDRSWSESNRCNYCGQNCGSLFYHCSCGLKFHVKCAVFTFNIAQNNFKELEHVTLVDPSIPTKNEDEEPGPFICDACGTSGNHAAYSCGPCDILIHKKCISLSRVIKSKWHDHRLSHTYFFYREYVGNLDCIICHQEVNAEHGSYACSKCNDIFHVNCVTKDEASYVIVENEDEEKEEYANSLIVLEWNDAGEAILVEHFKHDHPLRLGDRVSEHENKCCDGCLLPISVSFYSCSQCEFYLHKVCAELPKVKHVWHHRCPQPLVLTSNEGFECVKCDLFSNAFSYKCEKCDKYTCLRCVIALTPGARTCLGHKHNPLLFYTDYKGKCNACGKDDIEGMFRCKDCDICLDVKCFSLPITVQDKCDEHLLLLTDHDDNNYSESHFCDICEESRDPNLWFYHYEHCDTSADVKCVLGEYSFIKIGSIFEVKELEHPVTFVRKTYYYPNCSECGEPCLDFVLECPKPGCNYIHHASCPIGTSAVPVLCQHLNQLSLSLFCHLQRDGEEGEMEESNNYGHQHPLLLLNENSLIRDRFHSWCERCCKMISAPSFRCAEEGCRFYLHKVCAEAPLELTHPFHPPHPLLLMERECFDFSGNHRCNYCGQLCGGSFYHCSCGLKFHIRCAVFTLNIAQNNFNPFIPTKDGDEEDKYDECFRCWEPLAKYPYFFLDGGFGLHKKCTEFPLKMNHRCHRKHPLTLQLNSQGLLCALCQIDSTKRFFYSCSPCGLFFHAKCLSPSRTIEDKTHPHPFTLLWRQVPFICDACGTSGCHAAYSCGPCDILVHEKCISLPRVIKSKWHDHRLSHTYFLHREYVGILDCIICHKEVNAEHGSYACSKCNDIFHVNCVTKDEASYVIVENEDEEEEYANSLIVLEWNDAGEAIVVEHFTHDHPLRLHDRVSEHENKCCDGCLLPISSSFYYCSRCEFHLHKVCAELPKVKHVWHHDCPRPLVLTSNELVQCVKCDCVSNAFSYKCKRCDEYTCLRCVIALTPGARTCLGHKHNPLLFYTDYKGKCSGCGKDDVEGMFRCKDCDVCLDVKCFSLPITVQDKCDEHLLSLTDHDDNNYSESHFCDICEESRDPNLWFYHCVRCDTSTHVDCVLGECSFIVLGSIIQVGKHEHPLTFVKRAYHHPKYCSKCGKPCLDFALECTKPGCNYIRHALCP